MFLFHFLQLKITVWFGFIRCVQLCAVAPVSPAPDMLSNIKWRRPLRREIMNRFVYFVFVKLYPFHVARDESLSIYFWSISKPRLIFSVKCSGLLLFGNTLQPFTISHFKTTCAGLTDNLREILSETFRNQIFFLLTFEQSCWWFYLREFYSGWNFLENCKLVNVFYIFRRRPPVFPGKKLRNIRISVLKDLTWSWKGVL